MAQLFNTRLGFAHAAEDEAEWTLLRQQIEEQCDALFLGNDLHSRKLWARHRDFGSIGFSRRSDEFTSPKILYPAGLSRVFILSDADQPEIGISFRQRDIGRLGLPDIYEAYLYVHGADGMRRCISYSVPVQSPGEAFDRFAKALQSPHAEEIFNVCGGNDLGRVFGVAASPECLSKTLSKPAPTTRELEKLTDELCEALSSLLAVYNKWNESDALNYLIARSLGERRVRTRLSEYQASEQLEIIKEFRTTFEPSKKRSGRPLQGGKNHLVARTLAELWAYCGLGEPELWNESKFIRACALVLPWHGIHKADVGQFMRSELAKKARRLNRGIVLID